MYTQTPGGGKAWVISRKTVYELKMLWKGNLNSVLYSTSMGCDCVYSNTTHYLSSKTLYTFRDKISGHYGLIVIKESSMINELETVNSQRLKKFDFYLFF